MATTSGTVSGVTFNNRKVIEHAYRRAGHQPENLSAEDIEVAQDLLYTLTSEWVNAGMPLWTRVNTLAGVTSGSPEVSSPTGTVDVIHCYWRTLNPYRGTAATTGGADASTMFQGSAATAITVAGPNPGILVNFGSAQEVDTVGVVLGGAVTLTLAVQVYVSSDGTNYTLSQTLQSASYAPGVWTYFDLDPAPVYQYFKIIFPQTGAITLAQMNLGLPNASDILIGPLNIDDYYTLPDKYFQADRATNAYIDRQLNGPVIKLWPTPNVSAFYNSLVYNLTRRYIQDPGTMTNLLEVPQRWLEAIIWRLAATLQYELPTDSQESQPGQFAILARERRMQQVETKAQRSEFLAWSEERTIGPIRLSPTIRGYTR